MTNEERALEAARRWRLVLGQEGASQVPLSVEDAAIDGALDALYGAPESARGGLGASAPRVARWLGDIREYFPSSVVQVMQKDALDWLGLHQMLCEPEMLAAVEPDVHLVATLLSLNRAVRNLRPRHHEIDWLRPIRADLGHYQPEYRTVIPETRIGYGRRGRSLRDIVLCVDQSGSMASSVVYAGVFAAVLASIKAVSTSVGVFDTAVADLTRCCPTRSKSCSAPSSAAVPTSTARSRIARD